MYVVDVVKHSFKEEIPRQLLMTPKKVETILVQTKKECQWKDEKYYFSYNDKESGYHFVKEFQQQLRTFQ